MSSRDQRSYGATNQERLEERCDVEPGKDDSVVEREWHSRGEPWTILLAATIIAGKQCVALGVIFYQVFTTRKYVMSCNPKLLGMGVSLMCESTKVFVRCFPLLAVLVTILVASRYILQLRIYYQMLRHNALLDIENFSPLDDPLFRIVVACAFGAWSHFAIFIWSEHSLVHPDAVQAAMEKEGFRKEVEQMTVFYIVPTVVFLVFLYNAYDTESGLIPLNKYFEEDPEYARRTLGRIPFIPEPAAAAAVEKDIVSIEGEPLVLSEDEAYAQLVKFACARIDAAGWPGANRSVPVESVTPVSKEAIQQRISAGKATSELSTSEQALRKDSQPWHRRESSRYPGQFYFINSRTGETSWKALPPLSKWRLVKTMWPAEFLLRGNYVDAAFSQVWLLFSAVSFLVMAAVFLAFVWMLVDDVLDVNDGQKDDIAGVIVEAGHVLVTVWIARGFMYNAASLFGQRTIMEK